MIQNWKYQTRLVALVPYTAELASQYDGLLGHLYLRTKADGLLDAAFPGIPRMNMDKFVSYLATPKVALQIYYLQGEPMIPVGYCYLYNIDGDPGQRLAEFGFCFFKEYWGKPLTRELGWLCIAYWFEVLGVDILYGATLKDNWLARNYSRNFGFEEVALLPKFLRGANSRFDARIVVLEREKFLKLWREQPFAEAE